MPNLRLVPTAFALLLPFAWTTPASAQGPQKAPAPETEKPAPDDSGTHLSGLELMVRPTFGGAGAASPVHAAAGVQTVGQPPTLLMGDSSPYGSALGVGAQIGFRFHPVFAMGLRGDLQSISATAPNDGTTDLSRSRQTAGLYARGYPLALSESIRRYVDPWASIGVTYVHDAQSFHHPAATTVGSTVDASWSVEQHAIGVPVGIGVDYRLTKAVSIGPSFEYMFLSSIAGCAKQSAPGFQDNRMCTDSTGQQALVADNTGSWTLGLDLRLTPF